MKEKNVLEKNVVGVRMPTVLLQVWREQGSPPGRLACDVKRTFASQALVCRRDRRQSLHLLLRLCWRGSGRTLDAGCCEQFHRTAERRSCWATGRGLAGADLDFWMTNVRRGKQSLQGSKVR